MRQGKRGACARLRFAGIALAGILLVSGCVELQAIARERGSRELACPETQLTIVNRSDIDSNLFDVSGCGRTARYLCFDSYRHPSRCVREPNPDPAEEAAQKAAEKAALSAPASAAPSSNGRARVIQNDNPFGGP